MAFAITCSGPYGIENCVRTFGPAWFMVGLCIMFSCYVLPEILMTSDMMMVQPLCNGGVVTWAERGLGKPAAAFVALNNVAFAVLDLATYPTLVAEYVKDIEASPWAVRVCCCAVVILGLLVNLFKLEFSTNVYMVTLVAILLPFAIGFGLSAENWDVALQTFLTQGGKGGGSDVRDLNLFVTNMIWLSTGWDAIGNIAVEVSSPKALVCGFTAAGLAGFLVYALFMFGALAAGLGSWDDGYLAIAYGSFWEPLKPTIVLMGAVANVLLYATAISCLSFQVQAMADKDVGLELLPAFLAKRLSCTGAPAAALLAITALELCLVSGFDFEYFVQVSTLLHVFVFWVSLAAFVSLKFRVKGVDRRWEVPGGLWGAAAVACMRVPILALLCVCACGVPSVLIGAIAGNLFFLILPAGWLWYRGASLSVLRSLDSGALSTLDRA